MVLNFPIIYEQMNQDRAAQGSAAADVAIIFEKMGTVFGCAEPEGRRTGSPVNGAGAIKWLVLCRLARRKRV